MKIRKGKGCGEEGEFPFELIGKMRQDAGGENFHGGKKRASA